MASENRDLTAAAGASSSESSDEIAVGVEDAEVVVAEGPGAAPAAEAAAAGLEEVEAADEVEDEEEGMEYVEEEEEVEDVEEVRVLL